VAAARLQLVEVCLPYSYIIDIDCVRKHFHANSLRKFDMRVDSVTCDSLNDYRSCSVYEYTYY